MDYLAIKGKSGPVAGAVPRPVGLIPADYAAHVGADRRDGMERSVLVTITRDIVSIDLENRGLARRKLGEALRLAR